MSKKNKILSLFIVFLGTLFLIFFETKKEGFHEDEIYSITSSISEVWDTGLLHATNESVPIWKTKEEIESKLVKNADNSSSIKDVYHNQVLDVHPPLFYLCSHFFLLLFPKFVFQAIFFLNLLFFFLTNWMLVCILKKMEKEHAIIPTLLFYNFSMVMVNTFTFQRMYGMLTFFGLCYFYLNLKIQKDHFVISKKTGIALFLTTVFGFLTQYFFVIYALLVFLVQIVQMIKEKEYLALRNYFLIHVLAGISGLLLFPRAIYHILFGGRGVGSFLNLHYLGRLSTFLQIIEKNICLPWYFLASFLLVYLVRKKDWFCAILSIPVLVYFFIIVQIVPFLEIRYIMMIMPLFMLNLVLVFADEIHPIFAICFVLLLSIAGLCFSKPQFLYSSYQDAKEASIAYSDYSMVFLTDNAFTYLKEVPEMVHYSKTLVVNVNDDEMKYLQDDSYLQKERTFILRMESYLDSSKLLSQMKEMGYDMKEKLFENAEQIGYVMEVRNE